MSEKQIDDGGGAFPCPAHGDLGMSLRDYFAAAALQGMLASEVNREGCAPSCKNDGKTWPLVCAEYAYEFADAMLRARAQEVKP